MLFAARMRELPSPRLFGLGFQSLQEQFVFGGVVDVLCSFFRIGRTHVRRSRKATAVNTESVPVDGVATILVGFALEDAELLHGGWQPRKPVFLSAVRATCHPLHYGYEAHFYLTGVASTHGMYRFADDDTLKIMRGESTFVVTYRTDGDDLLLKWKEVDLFHQFHLERVSAVPAAGVIRDPFL